MIQKSFFTGSDGRSHSIFGPSSMETYHRCPRLWHYSTSYEPIVDHYRPHPMIGTLMHKAIASAMTTVEKKTLWQGGSLAIGSEVEDKLVYELEKDWQPNPFLELPAGTVLLQKAIKTALSSLEILLLGKIVEAVEVSLGQGTVDLALRSQAGIEIWDHKWHEKQDPKWVDRELRRTETTSQLWDYASFWLDQYEEAPVLIGKHMVSGTPNKAWRFGVAISPSRLQRWRESRDYWLLQAQVDHYKWYERGSRPAMNLSSCWDYGQCPFYGTCHNMDGDGTPPETLYRLRTSS